MSPPHSDDSAARGAGRGRARDGLVPRALRFVRRRVERAVISVGAMRHVAECRLKAGEVATAVRSQWAAEPARRTVAIVLLERMGDVVACEPVARRLRAERPGARIAWVVAPAYRVFVESNPSVDLVVEAACVCVAEGLDAADLFDEVIELFPDRRWCEVSHRTIRKRHGDRRITVDNYLEFGSLLTSFSLAAGLPPIDEDPRLHVPEAAVRRADALGLPARFVAFHCRSAETRRNWLAAKWGELHRRIAAELAVPVVELGLESELAAGGATGFIDLCGRLDVMTTAEVIRRSAVFVGVDSGPAHVANASGTRGVILLGPYKSFTRYQPFSGDFGDGSRGEIVRGVESVVDIEVDRVFEAAARQLR